MPSRRRSPRRSSSRWRPISAGEPAVSPRASSSQVRRQILVGKIDRGLELGERRRAGGAPALVERAELALSWRKRLAALRLGLGVDQIGEALGRGQVELAVVEGPAGELAGLGRPQPRHGRSAASIAATTARPPWRWSSATSSPVKLRGAGKPEHQRLVEIAARRPGSRRLRGGRLGAAAAARRPSSAAMASPAARAGKADHRDAAAPAADGRREDRVPWRLGSAAARAALPLSAVGAAASPRAAASAARPGRPSTDGVRRISSISVAGRRSCTRRPRDRSPWSARARSGRGNRTR